jgi:long-chain fatty acid transport protein
MQILNRCSLRNIIISATTCFFVAYGLAASAASFQSLEQSVSKLGTANSGTTTDTDDASIQYYNPAGMTLVDRPEIALTAVGVFVNIDFHPNLATNYSGQIVSGNALSPSTNNFLPSLYYVQPLSSRLALGFSIATPYGLATSYDDNSLARYFATTSKCTTVNLNPSLAYRVTDQLSLGVGFDVERMNAELDQAIDLSRVAPSKGDLWVKNYAADWGYGWNAGILYRFSANTRAGLAFHSRITHNLTGHSELYSPDQATIDMGKYLGLYGEIKSKIILPDTLVFSLQHKFTDKFTILGDIQYTHWSLLDDITLHYTSAIGPVKSSSQTLILNYHDSFRVALGQKYQYNEKLMFRTGIAFDKTPVDDTFRTARIPDANRYWLALGGNYTFNKQVNLDLGYGYILFEHSRIHQESVTKIGHPALDANYSANAQLFGAQLNINL